VARIEVPKTLIEDLAKDLGADNEVAESLVRWVINYLNRDCCWSVGFARLLLDLVSDDKMRGVLRRLGIEIDALKMTSEDLLKLGKILDKVVTYLSKAGIVEYVRSDGVVNLLRR
jgi:hypothetical protein